MSENEAGKQITERIESIKSQIEEETIQFRSILKSTLGETDAFLQKESAEWIYEVVLGHRNAINDICNTFRMLYIEDIALKNALAILKKEDTENEH